MFRKPTLPRSGNKISRCLRDFTRDEGGNVFVFIGLAIVVLVGAVGIAIDMGTQSMIKTRMQNAADAAALAGAIPDGATDAERRAIAKRYFALNYTDNYQDTDLTADNVGITVTGESVLVDTNNRRRKADILPVVGIDTIQTRAVSEVQNTGSSSAEIRDVVMVMDASGSMEDDVNAAAHTGGVRIVEARNAAMVMVDEILCKVPTRGNRIGWVQYSSACMNEMSCTNQTRSLALNGSCNVLRNQVSAYNPEPYTGHGEGWTNGAEGLERAESLMASARPNVVRAVIYMTDGLNNTYRNQNWCYTDAQSASCQEGSGSSRADDPARLACSRLKAQGILVYGVSFSSEAQSSKVVKDCVTNMDYYYYAPDAASLQQAFRDIVTSIKSVRITR